MDATAFIATCRRIADEIPDRKIVLYELLTLNRYAVALTAEWQGTPVVDQVPTGGAIETHGSELRSGESMLIEVVDGLIRYIRVYR
jgi:hypothetical protein